MDFRADGKLYTDIQGQKDTSTYPLSGDTQIVLNGVLLSGAMTFDIRTLTANSFIVYNKTITGPADFDEVTITLKR